MQDAQGQQVAPDSAASAPAQRRAGSARHTVEAITCTCRSSQGSRYQSARA